MLELLVVLFVVLKELVVVAVLLLPAKVRWMIWGSGLKDERVRLPEP
jgi:hypothetical protein